MIEVVRVVKKFQQISCCFCFLTHPHCEVYLFFDQKKSQKKGPGGELAELPQSEWNTPVWLTI